MPAPTCPLERPFAAASKPLALFVDLDGTLIATDSLLECLLLCVKHRPLDLLKLPLWLLRGRAYLKARLAADDRLDVTRLPYREDLCEFLCRERTKGREIYLATSADGRIAWRVARHLGLFDGVIASDGCTNMKGAQKLDAIRKIAKTRFTYAGNSRSDLVIWSAAESAILVNTPKSVAAKVKRYGPIEETFQSKGTMLFEIARVARIHQ